MTEQPMPTNSTRAESNRRNALKSTGPKDTSIVRHNPVKHGLLAEGVTELDNPETFPAFRAKLEVEYKPEGEVETFLVHRIALLKVRLKRAALLEAEYVTAQLHPPVTVFDKMHQAECVDPGLPARLSADAVDALSNKFQRYEGAIENKLYRAMHQLERLQRMRRGEMLPAPAAVDVALRGD